MYGAASAGSWQLGDPSPLEWTAKIYTHPWQTDMKIVHGLCCTLWLTTLAFAQSSAELPTWRCVMERVR
jgi:hypothetical protein